MSIAVITSITIFSILICASLQSLACLVYAIATMKNTNVKAIINRSMFGTSSGHGINSSLGRRRDMATREKLAPIRV